MSFKFCEGPYIQLEYNLDICDQLQVVQKEKKKSF